MAQYGPRRTAKTERRRLGRLGIEIPPEPTPVEDDSTQGTMFDRGLRPRVIYPRPKRKPRGYVPETLEIEAQRGPADTWLICPLAQKACDALVADLTPRRSDLIGHRRMGMTPQQPDPPTTLQRLTATTPAWDGKIYPVVWRPKRQKWYQERAVSSRARGAILPVTYIQYRKDWHLRCLTVPNHVADPVVAALRSRGHTVTETTTPRHWAHVKLSDR